MKERTIFHIDVNNAFLSWTAVYLLKTGYKIDIRNIASIIGGDEKTRRGIVLAKSPVAKKYGIVTAETIYQAKRKCPSLKMYPPNYEWYAKKSKELFDYLSQYSPLIEKFSIDECFIDMTGTNYLYNDIEELAYKIKDEIKKKFGYTVNIGIANNKLCAKMASDFEKPDKVHTLYKSEIEKKMWPLNVGDLFMCGKATTKILNEMKIFTIKDLAYSNQKLLEKKFKSQAKYLKESAWGIDTSKVEPRKEKNTSISTTHTLEYDCSDEIKLKNILLRQTEQVTRQLRQKKQYAKTVAVIYKNKDFKSYSAQAKLPKASNNTKDIYRLVVEIFEKSYLKEAIRLIGVRLADLCDNELEQISLFDNDNKNTVKEDKIQSTIDTLNQKFGYGLIMPASFQVIANIDKEKVTKK